MLSPQPAGQLATAPAFLHANPWPGWHENMLLLLLLHKRMAPEL